MEDTAIIELPSATLNVARKPGAIPSAKPSVQKYLDEGEALKTKLEQHKCGAERGNDALYDLLQEVYSFALSVEQSALQELIVFRMEKALEEAKIKVVADTSFMTLVVKYILRSDRQTAHTYSRALRVAYDEGIESTGLAAFLRKRGGVAKVTKTEAEQATEKEGRATATGRMRAYRSMLGWQASAQAKTVSVQGTSLMRVRPIAEGVKPGAFVFLIASEVPNSSEFLVTAAFEFTQVFEEGILREALKAIGETEEELREYAEKLERAAANVSQPKKA